MADPITTPDIEIVRTFAAPRDVVFRAWTTPAVFAAWFGGSEAEVPVATVSMDVRVGGSWSATMFAGPDRREIPWRGVYREVQPPARLVLTLSDQPGEDADVTADVIVVELTEVEGGTEMVFTQTGGHMPPEQYAAAKAGWEHFFATMAGLL